MFLGVDRLQVTANWLSPTEDGHFRTKDGRFRVKDGHFHTKDGHFHKNVGRFRDEDGHFHRKVGRFRDGDGEFSDEVGDFLFEVDGFRHQNGQFLDRESGFLSKCHRKNLLKARNLNIGACFWENFLGSFLPLIAPGCTKWVFYLPLIGTSVYCVDFVWKWGEILLSL